MTQYQFDINAAMKAGYTPAQIQAYLDQQQTKGDSFQLTQQPQATPQESQQPTQNSWADFLPTAGAVVGGIAGAALPILGETGAGEIGGSAVGSGLGETARELIEGKKLNPVDIGAQTALGGVGGGAGKVLGKVGGAVLSKTGQALEDTGDNLALKALRPTKTMLTNYSKQYGEDLGSVLTRNNLVGKDAQAIQEQAIKPLQDQFNNIVNNKNITVPTSTIDNKVLSYVDTLLKSPSAEDHQLADGVLKDYDFAIKQMGDNPTLADVNNARQIFDGKVNDWKTDPIAAGKNRILGNVFRQATQDTANANGLTATSGQSVQDLGKELSKLYGVKDIAELQGNLGRGNLPIGLTTILGGGLGEGLGTAVGGAAGGIPGMVTGAVATKVLNSPEAIAIYSKLAQNAGQALIKGVSPTVGKVLSQTAGQTATRALLGQPNQGNNNGSQQATYNSTDQNVLPPSPISGNNSSINPSISQGTLPSAPGIQPAQPPTDFMAGYTINGQPISDADKNLIYQIVNYRLDPTKMTSLKNNERERIISLASQYDPSYDSSQFAVKQKLREAFAAGGTQGKTINSLNTAIGHLYTLKQAANALGNGSITPLNGVKNDISSTFGSPKANNFNTVANAVSAEMATVFKNTGATDDEIRQWRNSLNPNMSPQQLQGSIDYMIQLMGSRLQALQGQYENGMGKPADYSFLTPESQMILNSLESNQNSNQLPATPQ